MNSDKVTITEKVYFKLLEDSRELHRLEQQLAEEKRIADISSNVVLKTSDGLYAMARYDNISKSRVIRRAIQSLPIVDTNVDASPFIDINFRDYLWNGYYRINHQVYRLYEEEPPTTK